eukprot:783048-Prymnesium_polylepis.1
MVLRTTRGQDQELTITVLNKDKGLISSVSVDNVPVEVCVAVSFGKATTAEPQSVRVVRRTPSRLHSPDRRRARRLAARH